MIDDETIDLGLYNSLDVKIIEIRDRATFIPAMAVRMMGDNPKERWLLDRAGYDQRTDRPVIVLCQIDGGDDLEGQCDQLRWRSSLRTMQIAHNYLYKVGWHGFAAREVIDVEYILGESTTRKLSESVTSANPA